MKSLIGIIKPFSETALSNLYAFFLDRNQSHGLNNMFLDSIIDLIEVDYDEDIIKENYEVKKEYNTEKGNYIDILVIYKHPKQKSKSYAIILENKIWHELDNDLQDYWDDIDFVPDKNKLLLIVGYIELVLKEDNKKIQFISHYDLKESFKKTFEEQNPKITSKTSFIIDDYFQYIDELYLRDQESIDSLDKFWNNKLSNENKLIDQLIRHFINLRDTRSSYKNNFRGKYFLGVRYTIKIEAITKVLVIKIDLDLSKINDATSTISIDKLKKIYQTNKKIKSGSFGVVKNITKHLTHGGNIVNDIVDVFEEVDQYEEKIFQLYKENQKEYFLAEISKAVDAFININYDIFLGNIHFKLVKDPSYEHEDEFIIFESLLPYCCFSFGLKKDHRLFACFWKNSNEDIELPNSISINEDIFIDIFKKNEEVDLSYKGDKNYYTKVASKMYKITSLDKIHQIFDEIFDEFLVFFEQYNYNK